MALCQGVVERSPPVLVCGADDSSSSDQALDKRLASACRSPVERRSTHFVLGPHRTFVCVDEKVHRVHMALADCDVERGGACAGWQIDVWLRIVGHEKLKNRIATDGSGYMHRCPAGLISQVVNLSNVGRRRHTMAECCMVQAQWSGVRESSSKEEANEGFSERSADTMSGLLSRAAS